MSSTCYTITWDDSTEFEDPPIKKLRKVVFWDHENFPPDIIHFFPRLLMWLNDVAFDGAYMCGLSVVTEIHPCEHSEHGLIDVFENDEHKCWTSINLVDEWYAATYETKVIHTFNRT